MRVNPYIANQMYLNYTTNSDSNGDVSGSILPQGTYSKLAAAKYIKDNDKDNDGKLTSDEVNISAAAFAKLDKDSDGYVTQAEMAKSLSGKDDEIFSFYKSGGSQSGEDITDELLNATSSTSSSNASLYVKMAAKAYIKATDKNGDGVITASEASALASNVFSAIDVNSNGSLTLSELQNALADDSESIYKYYKNGGTEKLATLTSRLLATI